MCHVYCDGKDSMAQQLAQADLAYLIRNVLAVRGHMALRFRFSVNVGGGEYPGVLFFLEVNREMVCKRELHKQHHERHWPGYASFESHVFV
jgi:hypothetical protein